MWFHTRSHPFKAKNPILNAMKLVFASDSFKGTLTSARIGELLEQAASEILPAAECVTLRMADGGEGTLDAIDGTRSCQNVPLYVHDALMRPTRCKIVIDGETAFVEAASTCGLTMLGENERNPLKTSSHGVGECIGHALYHGCKHIAIGLGGTSTNDGGMGCLRALGIRFYDENGLELLGSGADLARVCRIDESELFPQAHDAHFTILSDVTNPLLGPLGATNVFGRQKGADDAMLSALEAGMEHFAHIVSETRPNVDFSTPGYGAAGGLGMALAIFLGAQMRSGVETLLEWLNFDDVIADADLVVTGEGKFDTQSLQGKVVSGIADHARRAGVPLAVICGSSDLEESQAQKLGVTHLKKTSDINGIEYALEHPDEAFLDAAKQLFNEFAQTRT